MLKYSRTRTQQPQGAVQIDWCNPITRSLVSVALEDGYDVVLGRWFVPVNAPLVKANKAGRCVEFVGASSKYKSVQTKGGINRIDHSMFCLYRPATLTAHAVMSAVAADNVSRSVIFCGNNGSAFSFGSDTGSGAASATITANRLYAVGLAVSGQNSQSIWVDGVRTQGVIYAPSAHMNSIYHGARMNSTIGSFATGELTLPMVWNRALSDAEMKSLAANPWQIFKGRRLPVAAVVTAQYARPTSDVSAGTWTASTGSDLFAMLDETSANDSDYITTTSASTCEVALGSLSDPAVSTGHIVRYRISGDAGGIIVRLREGGTTIANWTHNPAPASLTTYEQTLSGAEADSITNYAALKLQFEAI